MAWTAGADVITGDLITAATWNNYLGATGSLEYLQSWQQNDATAARAIDGTIYQNTDDYIRIVTINCLFKIDDNGAGDIVGSCGVVINIENATPPTIFVNQMAYDLNFNTGNFTAADFFQTQTSATVVVPPGFYYRATATIGANCTVLLADWFEWGPA